MSKEKALSIRNGFDIIVQTIMYTQCIKTTEVNCLL